MGAPASSRLMMPAGCRRSPARSGSVCHAEPRIGNRHLAIVGQPAARPYWPCARGGNAMQYKRISADCHLDLPWMPPDLFTSQAPRELKDRMPYVVDTPDGQRWVAK